jgi:hypothetical protein
MGTVVLTVSHINIKLNIVAPSNIMYVGSSRYVRPSAVKSVRVLTFQYLPMLYSNEIAS